MEQLAVNLLPRKQRWYLRRRKLGRWLQLASFGIAGIYGLVLVGLFSWRLVVSGRAKTVQRRIDRTRSEIEALADVESQQLLVKSKLSRLIRVEADQVEFSELLGKLVNLFPAGISLGDVKVKSARVVEVSGRTFDPIALAEALDRFQDRERVADFLEQVSLENVTKSSSGEYALTLNLVPKREGGTSPKLREVQ